MSFNIADVTDFLTPGAVYHREDGRSARVLFLTNTALPQKVQSKFPPQVVYADENDNILSNSIENFLGKRRFYNIDPDLETRLNNLLAHSDDGDETLDLIGDDSLELVDDEADEDAPRSAHQDDLHGGYVDDAEVSDGIADISDHDYGEGAIDERMRIVTFSVNNPELPQILDPQELGEAVESYQQQPSADLNSTQHVLFIKASSSINAESLTAAFSPANTNKNQTLEFSVDMHGTGEMTTVDWSTFIGVYPCVFYGSRMYQVILNAPNLSPEVKEYISQIVAEAAPALSTTLNGAVDNVLALKDTEIKVVADDAESAPSAVEDASAANPATQVQVEPVPVQVRVQVQPTQQ